MSNETSQSPDAERPDDGRRRFCQAAIGGMAVVATGAVAYPVVSFLRLPKSQRQQEAMEIALSDLPDGSALWGDHMGRQIVVINVDGDVRAFDGSCPHLGCIVQWEVASQTFLCPCHGAIFSDQGEPTGGPVNAPLKPVDFVVTDGVLKIA